MISWLRKIKRNYALKRYVSEFPYYIARDNGAKDIYPLSDIEEVVDKYKLPYKNKYLAYSMFADEESFNKVFNNTPNTPSWNECRALIAKNYFNGNEGFKFHDLIQKTRFLRAVTITENADGTSHYDIRDFPDSSGMGGSY